jgi:hypothetical protein
LPLLVTVEFMMRLMLLLRILWVQLGLQLLMGMLVRCALVWILPPAFLL